MSRNQIASGTSYPCEACEGCDAVSPSRRRFLETVVGSVAGLLALPVLFTSADRAWAGAGKRYPTPSGDSVSIDHDEAVILARVQGHIYAMNLACPHQQAAVRWLPADHRFQCTKHDSKYTPEGVYMSGRATRNLDRFPIRRDGDAVVVDLDHVLRSDTDAAAWAAAVVTVS